MQVKPGGSISGDISDIRTMRSSLTIFFICLQIEVDVIPDTHTSLELLRIFSDYDILLIQSRHDFTVIYDNIHCDKLLSL